MKSIEELGFSKRGLSGKWLQPEAAGNGRKKSNEIRREGTMKDASQTLISVDKIQWEEHQRWSHDIRSRSFFNHRTALIQENQFTSTELFGKKQTNSFWIFPNV